MQIDEGERPVAGDLHGAGSIVNGDLRERLSSLYAESRVIADRFRAEVHPNGWHPFVPAQYECVEEVLASVRGPRLRFLEWGSASGAVTIMADMLGFSAFGIELDADLTRIARDLANRFDSAAQFVTGSFLPDGYRWESESGDPRLGTIGDGPSAYPILQQPLDSFDVVFGYPWGGEELIMLDIMERHGRKDAYLLLHGAHTVHVYRAGVRLN